MKRRLLIFISIFCVASAFAQDMKSVFVAMPDSITPLLTQVNKEDFIDFLASDMKARVKNRYGNVAEMEMLTDDYTLVRTSSVGTLEMIPLTRFTTVSFTCNLKLSISKSIIRCNFTKVS